MIFEREQFLNVPFEIDNNEFVSNALLDLSKAYGSIKLDILSHKLLSLGYDRSGLGFEKWHV